MEFKGQITHVFEPKTGTSQSSSKEWKTQEFRVEEVGVQYPASVVVNVFNDKVAIPAIGTMVNVKINASSREYNGKWYNSLTAWFIEKVGEAPQATPQQPYAAPVYGSQQQQQFVQQATAAVSQIVDDAMPF